MSAHTYCLSLFLHLSLSSSDGYSESVPSPTRSKGPARRRCIPLAAPSGLNAGSHPSITRAALGGRMKTAQHCDANTTSKVNHMFTYSRKLHHFFFPSARESGVGETPLCAACLGCGAINLHRHTASGQRTFTIVLPESTPVTSTLMQHAYEHRAPHFHTQEEGELVLLDCFLVLSLLLWRRTPLVFRTAFPPRMLQSRWFCMQHGRWPLLRSTHDLSS